MADQKATPNYVSLRIDDEAKLQAELESGMELAKAQSRLFIVNLQSDILQKNASLKKAQAAKSYDPSIAVNYRVDIAHLEVSLSAAKEEFEYQFGEAFSN